MHCNSSGRSHLPFSATYAFQIGDIRGQLKVDSERLTAPTVGLQMRASPALCHDAGSAIASVAQPVYHPRCLQSSKAAVRVRYSYKYGKSMVNFGKNVTIVGQVKLARSLGPSRLV